MQIKLNADVGEGMTTDSLLIPYLTYANIACGGHFGSRATIKKTIQLAKENNVKVGAHPSYPDKDNFGRKSMDISTESLQEILKEQIALFQEITLVKKVNMHHVKLHGALYNDVFKDSKKTNWFLNWMQSNYEKVKIFVPIGAKEFVESQFLDTVIFEAFADRNYDDEMQLVARSQENASIESSEIALKHVKQLFVNNKLITITGKEFLINADTFCLHGDNPNVIEIANTLVTLNK